MFFRYTIRAMAVLPSSIFPRFLSSSEPKKTTMTIHCKSSWIGHHQQYVKSAGPETGKILNVLNFLFSFSDH